MEKIKRPSINLRPISDDIRSDRFSDIHVGEVFFPAMAAPREAPFVQLDWIP
jgi:hypothetical protein